MKEKAIIVSAPSGAGKSTIVGHLMKSIPELEFSVSACSRPKRAGEQEGREYHFISVEEFREHIEKCDFLEWEEVYPGSYYGTLKSEVRRIWTSGKFPIFDVDVKGALSLKKYFRNNGLSIFIQPPSIEVLRQRLELRGTENAESLKKRFDKASYELTFSGKFDRILINDELGKACSEAVAMVKNFLG
jgi:guanylate kinase